MDAAQKTAVNAHRAELAQRVYDVLRRVGFV